MFAARLRTGGPSAHTVRSVWVAARLRGGGQSALARARPLGTQRRLCAAPGPQPAAPQPPPPPPPPPGHSLETLSEWRSLGLLDTSLSWPSQALLLGKLAFLPATVDLGAFLEGSRVAYVVVSRLLYERRFDELKQLVSPNCLSAMEQAMLDFGGAALRVVTEPSSGFEEKVRVKRAVLHSVALLDGPSDGGSAGADEVGAGAEGQGVWVQLDVRFEVDESFELRDESTGLPANVGASGGEDGEGGRVREQRSVWSFEGRLGSPDLAWRVVSIY